MFGKGFALPSESTSSDWPSFSDHELGFTKNVNHSFSENHFLPPVQTSVKPILAFWTLILCHIRVQSLQIHIVLTKPSASFYIIFADFSLVPYFYPLCVLFSCTIILQPFHLPCVCNVIGVSCMYWYNAFTGEGSNSFVLYATFWFVELEMFVPVCVCSFLCTSAQLGKTFILNNISVHK